MIPSCPKVQDSITVEESHVILTLEGEKVCDFFCTPKELEELCLGQLYLRGIIHNAEDVTLRINEAENPTEISASLTSGAEEQDSVNIAGFRSELTGDISGDLQKIKPPQKGEGGQKGSTPLPPKHVLREAAARMFSLAEIYPVCGGVHCAALLEERVIVAFKEDIGRHNAMDKVIGQALLDKRDFSKLIYLTSGRVNAEIIHKAAIAGLHIVVSRSIVSTIALETAVRRGIGLVGRIEWEEPIVYEETFKRR